MMWFAALVLGLNKETSDENDHESIVCGVGFGRACD